MREIRFLQLVNHENFAKLFGISINARLVIVSELVEGDTLDSLINEGLTVYEAIDIAR